MQRVPLISTVALAICFCSPGGLAQTCPSPPSSIDPSMTSKVSYNQNTGTYTYDYVLKSNRDSKLPIYYVALTLNQQPPNVESPDNWTARYIDVATVPPNLRWATITSNSSDSTDVGGNDLPAPSYAVQPGDHLNGFRFESPQRPGIVQYYAEGFTQVPSSAPTSEDDEPEPNCPGWDFASPRLQTLVTGMTTGPSTPGVIWVRIRIIRKHDEVDPKRSSRLIDVLVLSSRSFDASQIDVPSIRFGRGKAAPTSSEFVNKKLDDSFGQDMRDDWETFEPGDKEDSRFPDLLLTFSLESLAIKCTLDKAVFLTGTAPGSSIMGGTSTRRLGCDGSNR